MSESYNYKLIQTDVLFDFLYRLINYDTDRRAVDVYLLQLDNDSRDSFRIRLVCTLLDSLGHHFWQSKRRVQMDRFLLYFQQYILMKSYVLMDLEFMLLDTLDQIRPSKNYIKFDNLHDLNKAIEKVEEFENANFKIGYKKNQNDKYTESSRNLMTEEATLSYDELIDSLSYSQEEPA